jgi:predicted nucleic acid-binding protein
MLAGTLGILQRAARRRLLDLREAFDHGKQDQFRHSQDIMDKRLADASRHQAAAWLDERRSLTREEPPL